MKNKFLLIIPCFLLISIFIFNSCQKETISPATQACDTVKIQLPPIHDTIRITPPPNCDVRGTFTGTSTTPSGVTSVMAYKLQDNNFATGYTSPGGSAVTFGGYSNTCDSVTIRAFYISSYYLLQGKLTTTPSSMNISGTYKNLTIPSDIGIFSITK